MRETFADAIDSLNSPDRGFHFTSNGLPPNFFSFEQLRKAVRNLAKKLTVINSNRSKPVIILFEDQAEFVQAFLATIRAGLVVVPIYPPSLIGDLKEYTVRLEQLLQISGSRRILTSEKLKNSLKPMLPNVNLHTLLEINAQSTCGELPKIKNSDLALIQFTSGSTASPKGVAITHRNLLANAFAIEQALEIDPLKDKGVSWLPLYHDMGLIGFLVTPILTQVPVWFLPPKEFALRPHRWLDLLSQTQATISYSPNFGYDLVTRRIKAKNIHNWNLEKWRVAGCGGEAVLPKVLNTFADLLKPAGFDRTAFVASYGLAEATLAVSISPLRCGVKVTYQDKNSQNTRPLISSGKPVCNTEVRVVSPKGNPLSDGEEGVIQIRGASIAKGYLTENGFDATAFKDGWHTTDDLGVVNQSELHICGRKKEIVVLNGRNYYPHDIEECIQDIEGIKRGRAVAFGRPNVGSEQLVLAIETKPSTDSVALKRQLRKRIRERLALNVADIVIVGRDEIHRTTSGKLQRRALRARYLSHDLQGI